MGHRNGQVNGTATDLIASKSRKKPRKPPILPQDHKGKKDREVGRLASEFVGTMYQANHNHRVDGIFCPDWVMAIATTKAELLVLAQLVYWFGIGKNDKLRAKIQKDGFWWVAKTYRKLGRETHLSPDQVRGAIRRLRAGKVVIKATKLKPGEIARFRLNPDRIQELVDEAFSRISSVAEGEEE